MARSAPTLKRMFDQYNRRFFRNRLPNDTIVRWSSNIKWEGDEGQYNADDPPLIEICSSLKRKTRQRNFTLLHEMVHADHDNREINCEHHGKLFNRDMLRLACIGAFNGLW